MKFKVIISIFILLISYSCTSFTQQECCDFVELRLVHLDTSTENGYQYVQNNLTKDEKNNLILVLAYNNIPVTFYNDRITVPKKAAENKELIWNILSKSKDKEWLDYHIYLNKK